MFSVGPILGLKGFLVPLVGVLVTSKEWNGP